MASPNTREFTLGDWRVLPLEGRLARDGESVRLQPKAMDVLCRLAESAGEVVTREALLEDAWNGRAVSDEPLTRCIGELRRALGDSRGEPRFIETIPKRGYRLLAPVAFAERAASAPARRPSGRARRPGLAAAALATVAVAAVTLVTHRSPAPPPDASVAVLPFRNLGEDRAQDYFAEGLAEEVTALLTRFNNLRVVGRSSAFKFSESEATPREIGRRLGVESLLTGSVQASGERLRITAQLLDARSGRVRWGEVYDAGLDDVFRVQSEISGAIVSRLPAALTSGERLSLTRPRGQDPRAYARYLEGNYLYHRAGDEAGYRDALAAFDGALEVDPDFPHARLGRASVLITMSDHAYLSPGEGYEMARAEAEAALSKDPDLAEAYRLLGWIRLFHDWDFPGAEWALGRALALQPGSAGVLSANGALEHTLGREDRAIELATRAALRDPLRAGAFANLAYFSFNGRRYEESETALRTALELNADFPGMHLIQAQVHMARGELQAAAQAADAERHPLLSLMARSLVAHEAGRSEASDAALAELEETFGDAAAYQVAGLRAVRGETAAALDWLERAYAARDPGMAEMAVDRMLVPLHDEPRFEALVTEMGLDDVRRPGR